MTPQGQPTKTLFALLFVSCLRSIRGFRNDLVLPD